MGDVRYDTVNFVENLGNGDRVRCGRRCIDNCDGESYGSARFFQCGGRCTLTDVNRGWIFNADWQVILKVGQAFWRAGLELERIQRIGAIGLIAVVFPGENVTDIDVAVTVVIFALDLIELNVFVGVFSLLISPHWSPFNSA